MNRERFGFERVCLNNRRLISGERERGACSGLIAADFGTRERISGFVAVKGIGSECGGRTHLRRSGVQFAYSAN